MRWISFLFFLDVGILELSAIEWVRNILNIAPDSEVREIVVPLLVRKYLVPKKKSSFVGFIVVVFIFFKRNGCRSFSKLPGRLVDMWGSIMFYLGEIYPSFSQSMILGLFIEIKDMEDEKLQTDVIPFTFPTHFSSIIRKNRTDHLYLFFGFNTLLKSQKMQIN